MPTYQTIIVDITPGAKERPVINASQFDNGRPFMVALYWGGVAFTDAGDFDIEIHVKKPDGNIVTAEPESIVNEVCAFLTTEQMCACHGINECEIVLFDNDIQIGTGNFILDVEKAPDEGGIQSASEIANLAAQIARIVPEVIGDDYYNKTQTDALLANKADITDLPDMTQYYDKSQTDALLANKADITDLPDMTQYYTKSEVDTLIDNIYPTLTASGDVATFTTALTKPLVSVTADPLATTITRCGVNLLDSTTIAPFNANCTVTKTDNLVTVVNNNGYAVNFFTGADVLLVAGAYRISIKENSTLQIGIYKKVGGSYQYLADGITVGSRTATFTLTQTEIIRPQCNVGANSTYSLDEIQITQGATELSFEAYNGQTVPVADALTITTLTGVNNVFADAGSVTVQYKYMSM